VTPKEKAKPEKLNCRHGWRLAEGSFLPCPLCKPSEARALQGEGTTVVEVAEVAAKRKASARLGNQQPSRTLELSGKTLAGCSIGKMAADATANTRFHTVLACGHSKILDGTVIMTAERAGQIIKCPPCNRIDAKAAKEAKRKAARDG
jgi:hypothetical protein